MPGDGAPVSGAACGAAAGKPFRLGSGPAVLIPGWLLSPLRRC
jgi:hypothetical protein